MLNYEKLGIKFIDEEHYKRFNVLHNKRNLKSFDREYKEKKYEERE